MLLHPSLSVWFGSSFCLLFFSFLSVFVFFFFKQKTAYEMRISDWSSDVCSSDLLDRAEQLDDRLPGGHQGRPPRDRDGGGDREGRQGHPGGQGARAQIGRASCRERGCHYV